MISTTMMAQYVLWWTGMTEPPPAPPYFTSMLQSVDPGTWGKADQATMARRKVIKVRRGAVAEAADVDVAPANPFAGRSLLGGVTPAAAAADAPGKPEQVGALEQSNAQWDG
jgi:hypothetical protein